MVFGRIRQMAEDIHTLAVLVKELREENDKLKAQVDSLTKAAIGEFYLEDLANLMVGRVSAHILATISYEEIAKQISTFDLAKFVRFSNDDYQVLAENLDRAEVAYYIDTADIAEELSYKVDSNKIAEEFLKSDWAKEELPAAIVSHVVDKLS